VAVRLAREKDKADEMEAWLFGRQASLTPDLVRQGVREVAGVTDFDERYASVLASVRNDTALGASLGVNSTPTFFVNGVKIGGVQPQIFDYLIEYELSKVDAAKQ
jgi:protein-disulfide isomerase